MKDTILVDLLVQAVVNPVALLVTALTPLTAAIFCIGELLGRTFGLLTPDLGIRRLLVFSMVRERI